MSLAGSASPNAAAQVGGMAYQGEITAGDWRVIIPDVADNFCGLGTQPYTFAVPEPRTFTASSAGWYCTNKPDIDVPMRLGLPSSGGLLIDVSGSASFRPGSGETVYNHSVQLYLNQVPLTGGIVPQQSIMDFSAPLVSWQGDLGAQQTLNLRSQHAANNDAHYVIASDFRMEVSVDEYTCMVCAPSEAEARALCGLPEPATPTPTPTYTYTPGGPTITPTYTPGGPTVTLTPTGMWYTATPSDTPTPTYTPGGPTITPTYTPGGPTVTLTPTGTWYTATPTPTPSPTETFFPGETSFTLNANWTSDYGLSFEDVEVQIDSSLDTTTAFMHGDTLSGTTGQVHLALPDEPEPQVGLALKSVPGLDPDAYPLIQVGIRQQPGGETPQLAPMGAQASAGTFPDDVRWLPLSQVYNARHSLIAYPVAGEVSHYSASVELYLCVDTTHTQAVPPVSPGYPSGLPLAVGGTWLGGAALIVRRSHARYRSVQVSGLLLLLTMVGLAGCGGSEPPPVDVTYVTATPSYLSPTPDLTLPECPTPPITPTASPTITLTPSFTPTSTPVPGCVVYVVPGKTVQCEGATPVSADEYDQLRLDVLSPSDNSYAHVVAYAPALFSENPTPLPPDHPDWTPVDCWFNSRIADQIISLDDPVCTSLPTATPSPTPTLGPTPTQYPWAPEQTGICNGNVFSIFGCDSSGNAIQPHPFGANHPDGEAIDLAPIAAFDQAHSWTINDDWDLLYPDMTTVYAIAEGDIATYNPQNRKCRTADGQETNCIDLQIQTGEICYEYKHIIPSVRYGDHVLIGQVIGTIINHSRDPEPIVGAGPTTHLHLAKFKCGTINNNLDASSEILREVIP
jgi:hypothetical protein